MESKDFLGGGGRGSIMVSLLLLMTLIWNVRVIRCIMFYVAELSASEHLFEISAIKIAF